MPELLLQVDISKPPSLVTYNLTYQAECFTDSLPPPSPPAAGAYVGARRSIIPVLGLRSCPHMEVFEVLVRGFH